MKKLKSLTLVCLMAAVTIIAMPKVNAQQGSELTPSLAPAALDAVFRFLSANTNIPPQTNMTFVPYVSHAKGLVDSDGNKAEWGGGIAVLYPLNNYVKVGPRLQYLAGEYYLPSMNVSLQSSYIPVQGLTLTPALWSAFGTPIAGAGNENRSIVSIYGAGLSLKYDITDKWTAGLAYGTERWSGVSVRSIDHFGIIVEKRF